MPAPKWTFKSRFRANAYGWKGTALATKRLKEAVSEIKKVARSDPVTAADGAVGLMERIWPSLQGIDGSSGALGGAVSRTLEMLIPLVIEAPADKKIRSKWLDRLFEAVQEDGVNYLAPVEDQWGAICSDDVLDMMNAYRHSRDAAAKCGRTRWAETEVDQLTSRVPSSDREQLLRVLISERGR